MKGKGFDSLKPEEYRILEAFTDNTEIGFPVDCGFDMTETLQILQSLKTKDIISGQAPYKLTKKGKKVVKEWKTQ